MSIENISEDGLACQEEAWLRFESLDKKRGALYLGEGFLAPISYGKRNQVSFLADDVPCDFSGLEYPGLISLLNESGWETPALLARAAKNMEDILAHGLGLHNHLPEAPAGLLSGTSNILVLDQPLSELGPSAEKPKTLAKTMFKTARERNKRASLYVAESLSSASSPSAGKYTLKDYFKNEAVHLPFIYNPFSLIKQAGAVYAINSLWGFYALMLGKPVFCFGRPFYAGWGLTRDKRQLEDRLRPRSLLEIFAAAFMIYCRYENPVSRRPQSLEETVELLALQRQKELENAVPTALLGFQRFKRPTMRGFLNSKKSRLKFFRYYGQAAAWAKINQGRLVVWASRKGDADLSLAEVPAVFMEDGFIRSRGLGSVFYAPYSLVLDDLGIYYDPRRTSRLERLLAEFDFQKEPRLLERARALRKFMTEQRLTKYNVGDHDFSLEVEEGRRVVLVPGQVENDESIRAGTFGFSTNLELLREARRLRPEAFIIYKSHPDVEVSNRPGAISEDEVFKYADRLERRANMAVLLERCHEVHTMTSLSGFEALLKGLEVHTYGTPFYAGWGLTHDRVQNPGRDRILTLDELVAATLILYPTYYDWPSQQFCRPEEVVWRLMNQDSAKAPFKGPLQTTILRFCKTRYTAASRFLLKK